MTWLTRLLRPCPLRTVSPAERVRVAASSRWWRVVLTLALLGCTDDSGSRRALESHGFTDIKLTGWDPFGCSDKDTFSTGFRAKNPQGQPVSGVVCCGVLKSCTVRF